MDAMLQLSLIDIQYRTKPKPDRSGEYEPAVRLGQFMKTVDGALDIAKKRIVNAPPNTPINFARLAEELTSAFLTAAREYRNWKDQAPPD
jgi:hypothetical protein